MRAKQSQKDNLNIYLIDTIGLIIGFTLISMIRFSGDMNNVFNRDAKVRLIVAVFSMFFLYLLLNPNGRLFERSLFQEIKNDIRSNALLAFVMATFAYITADAENYSRAVYIGVVGFSFVWMVGTHTVYRKYVEKVRRFKEEHNQLVIVTTKDRAPGIITGVLGKQGWEFYIAGLIIVDEDMVGKKIKDIPVVANCENMIDYALKGAVDEVFIHLPYSKKYAVETFVENFEDMGIAVNLNLHVFDVDLRSGQEIRKFGDYYAVTFAPRETPLHMIMIKRALDICGALVGLVFTGIATVIVGPLLKLESKGPIFFSQVRVGRNGRHFKIYKFRSMYIDAEERKKELMEQNEMDGLMFKMDNDPRITKVGKFIRKTSIDELPQFWNVLKGDMSLVGTRPPTVDEFMQYEGFHKKRLASKPGITGVWQVSGRNDIKDFNTIVAMDVEYISNWSVKRDIEILFQTLRVVVLGSGAK
ncbi:MAG: sugar transferase [Anaerostipes sp.]|nr:sugar transferase [Anaerostipes sp.]